MGALSRRQFLRGSLALAGSGLLTMAADVPAGEYLLVVGHAYADLPEHAADFDPDLPFSLDLRYRAALGG